MKRYFCAQFPDDNIEVKVELLDQEAPQTCEAFWRILEKPIENNARHAVYVGRCIALRDSFTPEEVQRGLGGKTLIPPENLTCFPAPGDVLWVQFDKTTGRNRGSKPPNYQINMFYGPDNRYLLPMGLLSLNCFARIRGWETDPPTKNFEDLAKIGRELAQKGDKRVVFSRITG
ncbi:DUF3830 family protein [Candidatus Bathyarchaeota archaeon]|nr:DUF3830 family protein [Candidatus Bathyarchaeota archaeon]